MIIFGGLSLLIPSRSLVLSFISTLAVMVGFAMLVPGFTGVLMKYSVFVLEKFMGLLGRIAPRDVESTLSRTAIAAMALMVAVSVIIGVSLMVKSFRFTVTTWLSETLQGDLYISAPSLTATTPTERVDPQVVEIAANWPGVERVFTLRAATVSSLDGDVQVYATDNYSIGFERIFLAADVEPEEMWESLLSGSVLVSEPFADRIVPIDLVEGELWLEVDRCLEARDALARVTDESLTERVALGAGQAAEKLGDRTAACDAYRRAGRGALNPAASERARVAVIRLQCPRR